jgi:hypothetical protein
MVTKPVSKEFVARQLETLTPEGLLEVAQFIEFLQYRAQQPAPLGNSGEHAAFGIWADYPEAQDAAAFGARLRQMIETRQDAHHKPAR